ncbi:MAG: hypothetical protein Q9162_006738 [Coniocarpon cinnabarinum]
MTVQVADAADFYGSPDRNSLQLLYAYFSKYPDDAPRVVLSLKSCLENHVPKCDPDNVDRCVERAVKVLDGKKTVDIFVLARIDPETPIETSIAALAKHVNTGRIGAIGLSECSAHTLQAASSVHPIAMAELELSLLSSEVLFDGTAKVCHDQNVAIVAYSPLSRGLLTEKLLDYEGLAADDMRRMFPRFQQKNFEANKRLVDVAAGIARAKGVTLPQVAIAWVVAQGRSERSPCTLPIPGARAAERVRQNLSLVGLTAAELHALNTAVHELEVTGDRYPDWVPGRR